MECVILCPSFNVNRCRNPGFKCVPVLLLFVSLFTNSVYGEGHLASFTPAEKMQQCIESKKSYTVLSLNIPSSHTIVLESLFCVITGKLARG